MHLRVALQLMKLAREMRLQDFLHWLDRQEWRISEAFPEGFIELCLLYAVYADTSLDLREVAATLSPQSELRDQTMTFVEKMRMEGREEGLSQGLSQGLSRGEWIGKVRLLEELMGAEQSPMDELIGLEVSELARRFAALQADYDRQYKGR